ncbi:MAG: hypothetical protein GWN61_15045, partial [candidate division Zixibacteria bacterium]|nr:hypothetical protein [candidate division Zixibacteria bacterium]NIR65553.1 hypothetical protein [candidate division Zixibacteria bacterium]NIS47241.1 hypothetical protein [candidate division Zixibacteria bacterium]NIU15380.1 hypothetical protein [candidate division Zixibacteria bacterium]NIV07449.1 hypothetical protein [candidate division Zixibacteria bacterium]
MLDSVPLIGKPLFWRMGRGTLMKDDIWDIRYSREKKRLEKVGDRLERTENKRKFRVKNRADLNRLAVMRSFQGVLNKNRRQQNLLEAKEPTSAINEGLNRLRNSRKK